MSTNRCGDQHNPFKIRYKAIENFLRRLAFNLGNSPSQTDVKIISCIPIDVTDLQQRIICLEKQIQDGKCGKTNVCNESIIYPAMMYNDTLTKECSTSCNLRARSGGERKQTAKSDHTVNIASESVHLIYNSDKSENEINCPTALPFHYKTINNETKDKRKARHLSHKGKRVKHRNLKTEPLVYQTKTTCDFNFAPNKDEELDQLHPKGSYLNNIIHKQYKSTVVSRSTSKVKSEYSTPVCRDLSSSPKNSCTYDTDICSCCHGNFANVDNHMKDPTHNYFFDTKQVYTLNQCVTNNKLYYDSSFYDLIPVREKPKQKKVNNEYTNKVNHLYNEMEILCIPDDIRQKNKIPPYSTLRKSVINNKKNISKPLENQNFQSINQVTTQSSSNSCYVDCGQVYTKMTTQDCSKSNEKHIKPNITKYVNKKVANKEQNIKQNESNNTEETLHQIKSILLNVLTEIKTNVINKGEVGSTKSVEEKKNAFVQNTSQCSDIATGSNQMHSFTYSPYNINPYNLASCSFNLPSNNMYSMLPYQPLRCVQPIMVQPDNHVCRSHLGNSNHSKCSSQQPSKYNNTSTNTVTNPEERDNETEKLIKEIYKSVALNLDIESQESQQKENYTNQSSGLSNDMVNNLANMVRGITTNETNIEMFSNNIKINSSDSTTSRMNSDISTTTNDRMTSDKNFYMDLKKISVSQMGLDKITEMAEQESGTSISLSERSSGTESNAETVIVEDLQKKNDKPRNLISKIIKSVKLLNRRKSAYKESKILSEESGTESSNSDDYTTVYSEKIPNYKSRMQPQFQSNNNYYEEIPHKVHYNKRRRRQNPYMEQEYRRQWTENLAFKEDQRELHTSEQPISKETSRMKRPVFWQNIETRNVAVHPKYLPVSYPNVTYNNVDKVITPRVAIKNKSPPFKWLQNHKMGLQQCGRNWKKIILES